MSTVHFFIEKDAKILPAHNTWKVAFTNLIHKQNILICALYSIKCGRLSFEGKTNLLTESYLDLEITNFSVVKGSRPRSCLVRQSTEAAMMSQRQSTSLRYPLKIGVAADSDNMMGHKGASWSYRRSASTKLHAWDEGHKIL
jgi:hypothetical protein